MMLVKVGQKGQITIPKSMRDELGVKPGDTMMIFVKDGKLILRLATETIFDLVGTIPVPAEGPYSVEVLRETAKKYVAQQIMNSLRNE